MPKVKGTVSKKDAASKKVQIHIVHSTIEDSAITGIGDIELTTLDDPSFNQYVEGQQYVIDLPAVTPGGAGGTQDNNSAAGEISMTAAADTEVKDSAAGASTGDSQAAAGSTTRAAGSQTAQTQAGAGAAGTVAQSEAVGDISPTEAYTVNLKRLVDQGLDHDKQINQILVGAAQRLARNAEDYDGQLRQLALQSLANNVSLANLVNNGSATYQSRQKEQHLSDDVRANDNAGTTDKTMDSIDKSERERTLRDGDLIDGTRIGWLTAQPFFQDVVEAVVSKVLAKQKTPAA